MLLEVVASTAELEVGDVGGSVGGPVDDVVPVAPRTGGSAAGFDTPAVTHTQGPPLRRRHQAGPTADVEDLTLAAHEDAADGGVAGEHPHDRG